MRGITANVLDVSSEKAHVICMSDKRSTREWRSFLTADEKKELASIEREIKELKAKIAKAKSQRNRVQNRSTVRAGK